ncbi:hypothetical protein FF38_03162 [Lucilia cuprina]|uniref:Uncharacterized protein n=1 Tax=Lucilia cuprina TaxID=7375 RepID=A0A0L0CFH9_LUCCU|nr:hypothetical protein FF38_03162 [Lucilia cuprina]
MSTLWSFSPKNLLKISSKVGRSHSLRMYSTSPKPIPISDGDDVGLEAFSTTFIGVLLESCYINGGGTFSSQILSGVKLKSANGGGGGGWLSSSSKTFPELVLGGESSITITGSLLFCVVIL